MEVENNRNVVIIGPAHPFRGGIADTNEAMARAFDSAGHQVDLITFTVQYPKLLFPGKTQFSDDPAPSSLKIHRWVHSLNPFNWITAAQKIRRLKPDVVIIRYWLPFMAPCLGTLARLLRPHARVIGLTDNVVPHEDRMMDQRFTAYFMRHCDAFMALSKAVQEDLKGLSQKPSGYFPHPINDQLGDRVSRDEAIGKLQLDPTRRYMLFFGFIRKYKGLDLLLEALAEVERPDLNLLVAGENYDSLDPYLEIIRKHRLENRVVLRNDFIPSREVPLYFGAADLVTQTYRSATQSGITQMALHFEVPVLVTKVGGLEEFVVEGKTGLFSKPDPSSIAQSINAFFESKEQSMVAAIQKEKQRFTWSAFVEYFDSKF